MQDIKILELLVDNLKTCLDEIEIFDYEKYPTISKFVKEYQVKNPGLVEEYLRNEDREEDDEFTFNDVISIIDNQIKSIREIVKTDLKLESQKELEKLV